MKNKHTIGDLRQMQSLPLSAKIQMTRQRIRGWVDEFGEDGVYVSFSGGKDSTVLLDVVRKDYPSIEAVFVNTGLEYPSVRQFALSKENVTELRPKMNFRDVIIKYGYPIISKEVSLKVKETRKCSNGYASKSFNGERAGTAYDYSSYSYLLNAPFQISDMCCSEMKKKPVKEHEKKCGEVAITAQMAEESQARLTEWLVNGCNSFEKKRPISNPMSFWTEQDVLTYIHTYNLAIADAYGQVVVKNDGVDGQINIHDYLGDYRGCQYETTGCKRTGCVFCLFGIRQDLERMVMLAEQEPKLCDYVMRGGEFSESGMWQPSKDGLGYWFVLEWLNVHGNLKIGIPNREYYIEKYGTERGRLLLTA
ncbi:phosphoadenosine phosphosulfate reductase domain-containing protein [Phocaeicola sartorii]|uniref:phosphoadenosine phosphosulfate reductase domain-containing protein n=1 Tax=Phocaeicola sartorii TaxID=671267 RepID=UPI00272C2113|nr:phosphoadenosine phosphosulfate reductase family protein [Phocaeicola sartorii]